MHFLRAPASFLPLLLSGTMASCSSSPPPEGATAEATIGPAGGELVGTVANGFPGFVLKVPAGALAQPTTVRFEGTLDDTPLPGSAEQIGPHVRIVPVGTALAKPALLTTPVDPFLRELFDNAATECKVWARDGAGWTRREAVATTPTSVTVELSSFTTAAAGVLVAPRLPTCGTGACRVVAAAPEAPCVSDTGYCLTPVRDPEVPLQTLATVTATVLNNKVYYLNIANGTVAGVRYDLDGASPAVRSPEIPLASNSVLGLRRVEATNEDTVWAPIRGLGNVKFAKTGLPQRFDFETGVVAEAVVVTGPGELDVTRVSSLMDGAQRKFFARSSVGQTSQFATGGTDSVGTARVTIAGKFFFRDGNPNAGATCVGSAINADSNCATPDLSLFPARGGGAIAVALTGEQQPTQLAAADPASDARKSVFVFGLTGKSPASRTHQFPSGVSSMDFGGSGSNIFAVNTSVAEVMIMSFRGGLSTFRLTEAAVGTPEYEAMLPRRIIRIGGKNELLVIVKGDAGTKKLWRLREATP